MKQSKTVLKELTAAYRAVLRHGILCNAIALGLLAAPAMAGVVEPAYTAGNAFVLGDIVLSDQLVSHSQAAFAGRRMNEYRQVQIDPNIKITQYRNDFPAYKMVARSLDMSDSDTYVGPVTLNLRELNLQGDNADVLTFNYQQDVGGKWTDVLMTKDNLIVLDWGVTESTLLNAGVENPTAWTMATFAHLDSLDENVQTPHAAGSLKFDNVDAVVDGATIVANTMNITNGSTLTFVNGKSDTTSLDMLNSVDPENQTAKRFYTEAEYIDTDGITKLNAETINIDGSAMVVKSGADLRINEDLLTGSTTIKNVSSAYGALTANGNGSILIGGDSLIFDNNTSSSHGAALYFKDQTAADVGPSNGALLLAKNVTFSNNTSDYKSSSGGAVFNTGGQMLIFGKNNTFTGNKILGTDVTDKLHKRGGGAIANQSYEKEGSNPHVAIDAKMWIGSDDSTNLFENNTSSMNGGAVMNRAVDEDGDAYLTIAGTTTFNENSATLNGGAIYNFADDGKEAEVHLNNGTYTFTGNTAAKGGAISNAGEMYIANAAFTSNTATTDGGAIYNESNVVLSGVNNFTGNKAANKANDIHNLGTLTIASGTTTIDGGVTGDGTLTIANGATLNIGTASVAQNTITLNGNMLATLREGDAQITAGTFTGNGTLKLTMVQEGTYKVFGDKSFANIAWDESGVMASSPIYNLTWDGGDVTATRKTAAEIAEDNNLTEESGLFVSNLTDSSSDKLKDLSVKLQEKLAEGDTESVEHATKAVHPETESVVQSVSTSVQNTVVNLASARMVMPSVGRAGGDVNLTSGGMWVQGLYNKSKQADAFSGYTRGIAAGLDGTINKVWTIGAGYSFAHSNVGGTARDTEIDSNTFFLYGQYKPSNWYLNAVANYTWSDYSENGTILENTPIFADYNVDSFGGNIATGYDFDNGITPELGLRYIHVSADDYTNSYGVKTHLDDSDYMTGILGARYVFNVVANRYTTFMPQLHAAAKYDLLSDKNVATVTMPGINSYVMDGERLNRFGGEFGIGLGVKYGNLDVSLNYDIDVRKDYTSQTGMLKLRANF